MTYYQGVIFNSSLLLNVQQYSWLIEVKIYLAREFGDYFILEIWECFIFVKYYYYHFI